MTDDAEKRDWADEVLAALQLGSKEGLRQAMVALCNGRLTAQISEETGVFLREVISDYTDMEAREVEARRDRVVMETLASLIKSTEGRIARIESVLDQIWERLKQ